MDTAVDGILTGASCSGPVRVSLSDSYAIAGLMCESLAGVDLEFDAMTRTPLQRWWVRHIHLPIYFHFLNEGWKLVCDGSIAAYLYLLFGRESCHVNDIGVVPAYRRRGLARLLMTFAERRALDRGLPAMTLAVTVHNTPAVNLYRSLGYRAAHHCFWRGESARLPTTPRRAVRRRELSPEQRVGPFREFWARSLEAAGLPAAALLADQARYWWTPAGRGFELWGDEPEPLGYADLLRVEGVTELRIFPARPDDPALVDDLIAGLAAELKDRVVHIELGSEQADRGAEPLLRSRDFACLSRGRMLMAKSLAPTTEEEQSDSFP